MLLVNFNATAGNKDAKYLIYILDHHIFITFNLASMPLFIPIMTDALPPAKPSISLKGGSHV